MLNNVLISVGVECIVLVTLLTVSDENLTHFVMFFFFFFLRHPNSPDRGPWFGLGHSVIFIFFFCVGLCSLVCLVDSWNVTCVSDCIVWRFVN